MTSVLITGGPGSGKTMVAAELARRGRTAVDADDESLARWVDSAGQVARSPALSEPGWLTRHRWEWDQVRLNEILSAAALSGQTLYVCGNASNVTSFFTRFDHVILLELDEPTMLQRLDEPSREGEFGRGDDTRALLRSWLPGFQQQARTLGAQVVDATAPLESVVESVLCLTPSAEPRRQ